MFFSGPLSLLLSNPVLFFAFAIAVVVSISVHEFAHALAADKLGDQTPRYQGRLSLNPLVHLDPVGTIMILFLGIGWGKPVMFNPWNLKNPKFDSALISIAGPMSNFLNALIFSLLYRVVPAPGNGFFVLLITFNITLGVFNLIPMPPLDGYKVVGGILPKNLSHQWSMLERYGFYILILMILPVGNGSILSLILEPVTRILLGILTGTKY